MAAYRPHKPFAQAIHRALHQWEDDNHKGKRALDVIAMRLVRTAATGEDEELARHAAREIADRLDGKPHVSVDATVTHQDGYEAYSDAELMARIAELQARLHRAGMQPQALPVIELQPVKVTDPD